MRKLAFPLLLAVVVAGMIGLFAFGNKAKPEPAEPKQRLGTQHASQGQQHIQPDQAHAAYNSNPPSSGPHYASPAPWGIKDTTIADETLIHNLEHGGVVIAYKPDLPAEQIEQLKEIFNNLPPSPQFNTIKAILVPRAANSAPVQLAAWTYTHDLPAPDKSAIEQFYTDHIDQGPELVP